MYIAQTPRWASSPEGCQGSLGIVLMYQPCYAGERE
nr:MAG TPA: hypothetical protein [Microviridae sp.]